MLTTKKNIGYETAIIDRIYNFIYYHHLDPQSFSAGCVAVSHYWQHEYALHPTNNKWFARHLAAKCSFPLPFRSFRHFSGAVENKQRLLWMVLM
jgi:hypothetical protein